MPEEPKPVEEEAPSPKKGKKSAAKEKDKKSPAKGKDKKGDGEAEEGEKKEEPKLPPIMEYE